MKKETGNKIIWVITAIIMVSIFGSCNRDRNLNDPFIINSSFKKLDVHYVDEFPNANHPQIIYWFITPDILENDKYLSDLEYIAANAPFDMIYITAREGVDFYDDKTMHPVFEKMVKRAHELDIKIGLQLWQDYGKTQTPEENDALVVEKELTLDLAGKASCTMETFNVREVHYNHYAIKSELLKAYLFKKAGNGFYQPETFEDISHLCKSESSPGEVSLSIDMGQKYAGYQVYLMSVHYRKCGNLFDDYFFKSFDTILEKYADIPFDGTGLDEFKCMPIKRQRNLHNGVFLERRYSIPFSNTYLEKYGKPLEEELFHMRYAPAGNEAIRITAINTYMEEIRKCTGKCEKAFYDKSRALFGNSIFNGLHNTYHRGTDELWHTGRNYWNLPRAYGQTDERTTKPVQIGIMYSNPKNMLYNMYYDKTIDLILNKASDDLRFNIRTHYHALNDCARGWGVSMEGQKFLDRVNPFEMKVRLLNHFNPASPETDLLIVFGFEAMTNWYPEEVNRDAYNLNDGHTQIFQKAASVLDSGYLNALVPADAIVEGMLKLDEKNRPVYNGHLFEAMIFLYPQFSKESTIRFLERYVENGGKLMLEGPAEYDYYGNDVSARFQKISDKATVRGFSIDRVEELVILKNNIPNGCKMEDGSIVMSDLASIENNTPVEFSLTIDGDHYKGAYTGVLAILSNKKQGLQKLACGNFKQLKKNGKVILELDKPADVYLEGKQKDLYSLWIQDVRNNR